MIVEQYHALWHVQPEIHYSSGLVIATLRALVADEEAGGSGLPQSAIALEVNRSPVLVTRLMKEMEAAGFVERGQGKFDHRQRAVRITAKGQAHLTTFDDLKASIGEQIFAYGTPEVWEQVTDCLEHVGAVLKSFGEARRQDASTAASLAPRNDG
ncbi:MAG: winged helix-turn-helix transcriptional regulator [Caulobacterales bacterium]|nr:winged helix-turn-helix transcriptional regulator [Caulobacterales bacterium]